MKLTKRLKQAIKNPPAERLAKIEYQSHLLQALGIIAVSIILFIKGFWYIIFALIFGVGVSYSQGMTAYKKYKAIQEFSEPYDYEKDKSPSRKRAYVIDETLGSWVKWPVIISSVIVTCGLYKANYSRWILTLIYPITILTIFILIYYFPVYWLANIIFKKMKRGENKNGKKTKN